MEKLWISLCIRCGKAVDNSPPSPPHTPPLRKIYKYPPLRSALAALVILCASGCTVAQEKAERYRAIGEQFSNPKRVIVHYEREDDTLSGMECRCFGEACEQPPFTK